MCPRFPDFWALLACIIIHMQMILPLFCLPIPHPRLFHFWKAVLQLSVIGFPLMAFNLILLNQRFFLLDLVKNVDWLNSQFPLTSPLLAQLFVFLPLLKYSV